MATSYHQHMVTLVMMAIVSMLMALIYIRKIDPFLLHQTFRRDFTIESHQNLIPFGHVLPRNGSFAADKTSVGASENHTPSGNVVRLLPLPNNPKLISHPRAIVSHRDNGDLRKSVIAKFNNLSTFNKSDFSREKQEAKINQTVPDQDKMKQVSTTCSPKKNVVLLKTHKTGSSTIQNILYRYGDNHDLVFALPKGRDNYFGGNTRFSRGFVRPLPSGHQVNILANHARWNKKAFVAMMPNNTIYITILRHPVTQYESLYIYYNWEHYFHVPFHEFVKDPAKFCDILGRYISRAPVHSFKNPSLYDLGMKIGKKELGKDVVEGKLHSLEEDFHLVLLMEYMEESVILLKELMCWSWEDVLYFATNSRSQNQINKVTPEMSEKLLEWNAEDWMLYKHFNKTFWTKVKDYGFERMKKDKMILRKKVEEIKTKCLQGTKIVSEVGTTIKRYQLSVEGKKDKICSQMVTKALEYMYFLNDKMSKLS
ncbi:Galactosylceramide sulfotransferase [Holothuria leucospilota]|uniref:Galactosylceramide sulfotransferase n=1 Tax=Holothuria leucospilota TaxID=206669 RepID=A0A9Q1H4M9_HOLLE|nr:Galactosylceramide sulfotransferase [Holothuria leucospilota]